MYPVKSLEKFTRDVFMKMGCSQSDAEAITKVLIAAELRGIPSHGMIRIKDYHALWKAGRMNTVPDLRIVHESPSTAVVDGDNAVGMLPSVFSMELAIRKAGEVGTGWVATRNSNHFGIAGYYAMMALQHDMIGISMTNANPLVAPTFSVSRLLGTNPIAVAIPALKQPPFVADFSTTPIVRGKLAIAARQGQEVPFGYVQDAAGRPSHDPDILKEGGAMVTLGGDREHGSHKGYCLSAIVDIFSAVFSGANFGPFVPPCVPYLPVLNEKTGEGTGHFFGAMRIDAFQPADVFKHKMDQWIETFRKAKSMEGQPRVLIPGDPEWENEQRIRNEGINVIPSVVKDLKEIAAQLELEFS